MTSAVALLAMAASWASAAPLRIGLTVPAPLAVNPAGGGKADDEEPAAVARLGVDGVRYAGETPFDWTRVQPAEGVWDFEGSDAVIDRASAPVIVPLFAGAASSLTPPWDDSAQPPAAGVGPDARRYIEAVVGRYASAVRYWELGDALGLRNPADSQGASGADSTTDSGSAAEIHAERMGRVSAEIAGLVRRLDSDAVVVLRVTGSADAEAERRREWLAFFRGAGPGAFDVLAYRGLEGTQSGDRTALAGVLGSLSSDSPALWRIDSGPMSAPESPANEVIKRTVSAWAEGDQAVIWLGGPMRTPPASSEPQVRDNQRLLRRFASHLGAFEAVTEITGLRRGQFGYHFRLANGTNRWVMWGRGTAQAPSAPHAKGMTTLDPVGSARWGPVPERIALTAVPVLLRD